jgi:hypothetical protein
MRLASKIHGRDDKYLIFEMLVQKDEWNRQLIRLGNEWEDNIKMGLQEFGFHSMVEDIDHRTWCMVHISKPSISAQRGQLLGYGQLLYWLQFGSLEYDVKAAAQLHAVQSVLLQK